MVEKSLVFIKPDGVQRKLVGRIVARFEDKGFNIEQLRLLNMTSDLVDTHYEEHVEKPFFPDLKKYIMSGPIVVMVLEGEGVITNVRKMVGATNPVDAEQGTIRADYALTTSFNIIHASDSSTSAEREIANFFG